MGLYDIDGGSITLRTSVELDVAGALTAVPQLAGQKVADLLLINDRDLSYAKLRFDSRSLTTLKTHLGTIADPLSRRAIFARDGGRCVYCTAPATSIDHVIPRSRGGGHNWENVVSACHKCNHLKADKQLKEIGWRLRQLPREPVGAAWRILGTGRTDERWLQYLQPFGVAAATA